MAEMRLGFKIEPSRQTLLISLYEDEGVVGKVSATADEVELLIKTLADCRRLLRPEVRLTPPGAPVKGEADPAWAISVRADTPETTLMIRNSGLAWVSLLLSASAARELGAALMDPIVLHPVVSDPVTRPN
jgi:hypothetical protein